MSFTKSIKTVFFQKYATFKGRASRSEFWWFWLFWVVMVNIIPISELNLINLFLMFKIIPTPILIDLIILIIGIIVIIPYFAVSVRRLHDINRSGWLWLVPVGSALVYEFIGNGIFHNYTINLLLDVFSKTSLVILYCATFWILYLNLLKSDPSDNKYGPNPRLEESSGYLASAVDSMQDYLGRKISIIFLRLTKFLNKLRAGDYGLFRTFWLYGLAFLVMFQVIAHYIYGLFWILRLGMTIFWYFQILGLWNSASLYEGNKLWSITGKLLAIIAAILVIYTTLFHYSFELLYFLGKQPPSPLICELIWGLENYLNYMFVPSPVPEGWVPIKSSSICSINP